MVVNLVTVILQLGGGCEELAEVYTGVGATVVSTRVDQSLVPIVRVHADER